MTPRLTLAAVLLLTAAADARDAQPVPKPRTAFVCLTDPAGAVTCHAVPQDELCARLRGAGWDGVEKGCVSKEKEP